MKTIRKILLLISCSLILAFFCSHILVKADEIKTIKVSTYYDLEQALNAPGSANIILTEDISKDLDNPTVTPFTYQIYVRGFKYLDLNGHDIYVWENSNKDRTQSDTRYISNDISDIDVTTLFCIPEGTWLVVGDSVGGAVVSFDAANISKDSTYNTNSIRNIFDVAGGKLTVNGGEFNAGDNHKAWFWSPECIYTHSNPSYIKDADYIHGYAHTVVAGSAICVSYGKVVINGGTFVGRSSFYANHYYPEYCAALSIKGDAGKPLPNIVIYGGSFDGRCGADAVRGVINDYTLAVYGGSFDVHRIETERIYHVHDYPEGGAESYGTSYVPYECIKNCDIYLNGTLKKDYIPSEKNETSPYSDTTNKIELVSKISSNHLSITTDSTENPITTKFNTYYNYIKGSNFTLTLNFDSFYSQEDGMPYAPLDLSYETKWTIKKYKNGQPTGQEKTEKTYGNTLNLDEVLTRWNTNAWFDWDTDKDTHFVISAVMVEYYNDGEEIYSHVYKSNSVNIISNNSEITDWKLDLSQVGPDTTGKNINVIGTSCITVTDVSVYLSSDLQTPNTVQNADGEYVASPLQAGKSYYLRISLHIDDNYTAAILPEVININSLLVKDFHILSQKGSRTASAYQDLYGRDITWISGDIDLVMKVQALYPLEGTVSLDIPSTLCFPDAYVDINATTGIWYGYEVCDDEGKIIYETDIYYSIVDADNEMMESGYYVLGTKMRLIVMADYYKGCLYSEWRTVCKEPNYIDPKAAELQIEENGSGYSVAITNYNPRQEYILRTGYINPEDLTESDWEVTLGQTFDVKAGKFTIYTRLKETDIYAAGSEVFSTTDYAGGSVTAESLVLSQTALALEAKEEAYITAKLLPATQTTTDAQYIRWSVSEGDPNLLSIRVDGHYEFWPEDGYVTGSTICIYARAKGVVELTAEITLPGNVRAYDRCTIYISEGGEFYIENVTQPEEKVYLLPDDCFQMWEYSVVPSAAYWTASEGIVWKILKVEGDPSHFSLTESGWLETNDAVPGEKVYVYPDISSIYHYTATHTTSPVNPRCFEVKDYEAYMVVGMSNLRSRSGSATKLNPVTYNTSEEVSYVSSNSDVATVDETGTVQMLTPGTATITVTCGDLVETVEITVEACFHSYIRTDSGDGTHKKVCEKCGDEVIEAHTLGDTMISDGEAIRACGCGYYETVAVPERPAELSITPAPHVHTVASESGDITYDTKAHWFACEDSDCPDYEGSITDYAEHTFKEETFNNEDGSTVTYKYCSVCGYKSEAKVSYLIGEKEEKSSLSLPVYDIEDASTHEAYTESTVVSTPTPAISLPVETKPSLTPFPMAEVTATPTPVPIATKAPTPTPAEVTATPAPTATQAPEATATPVPTTEAGATATPAPTTVPTATQAPDATPTVTPEESAENTGSSLLIVIRIILAAIALALVGGICFELKKLKGTKKEEKGNGKN